MHASRLLCRFSQFAIRSARVACCLELWLLLAASSALAQLPATRLGAVFPAGGQPGQTLEVTIAGADLDDVDQLLFSHPGIKATRKMAEPGPFDKAPRPVPNQFVVQLAGNVPLGLHEVRAQGKYGVSNPRAFAVGDLPESIETEPNNDVATAVECTLPATLNGLSNAAGDVDYYRFTAPAGQRLIVAAHSRQVDSPLDTVLTLYDAAGRVLGSSHDDQALDSLLDVTTPAAGQYVLKVHDAAYQGGPEHVYRVSIGVLPHIDFVFPPAGPGGGGRPFTIYGRNLPGGQPAGLTLDGRPLEKAAVTIPLPAAGAPLAVSSARLEPAAAGLDLAEYRVKGPQGSSNPVLVGVATAAPVLEAANNDSPAAAQPLAVPCEVQGQFYPQRDQDWYQVQLKAGQVVAVDVISQRIGAPTNPQLVVQRVVKPAEGDQPEQVQQLAFVFESDVQDGGPQFDVRHDDPAFTFTASDDGFYRLMVHDGSPQVVADPRRVYRLSVTSGQPDFRLAAAAEDCHSAVFLRKGGQVGIRVVAFRQAGFDGEITVTATGLPAGVTSSDAIIGPASNHAMLVLTAAENAAPATAAVQITGRAKIGTADVVRQARLGVALAPTVQRGDANQQVPAVESRVARDLVVSISPTEVSPIGLQAGGGQVWENSRAAQIKIPYTRSGPFKGAVSVVPRGLPPNVNAPAINIGANATTGEFQVNLNANTPLGTYTFYLDAIAQQVDYNRNPEAAAAAAERKKEVDQIKVQADAEAKTAADAKAAADRLATETANAVTAARNAKAAADKLLADAMAAGADADKLKTARDGVAAADKALAEAEVRAKAAADAKTLADQQAAEKAQRAQLAAELKTQTDQMAVNLENAAKPQKRNVPVISTPITLKITPAPITLAEVPAVTVKQGEKAEATINIARLYGYTAQINLNVVLPSGVGGLSIPNAAIPANQTQAKLAIDAAASATEGQHELTVRATLNLNGQNLTVDQPLRLVVQKGAATQ